MEVLILPVRKPEHKLHTVTQDLPKLGYKKTRARHIFPLSVEHQPL